MNTQQYFDDMDNILMSVDDDIFNLRNGWIYGYAVGIR